MNKKLINATEKTIRFLDEENNVITELSPSDVHPICEVFREIKKYVESEDGVRIPIYHTFLGEVKGLPDVQEDTVLIVDAIIAEALDDYWDSRDIYVPEFEVRDKNGVLLGYRGIRKYY